MGTDSLAYELGVAGDYGVLVRDETVRDEGPAALLLRVCERHHQ